MIYIDKCAYTNRLAGVHPVEKLFFVILTMIVCLISSSFITSIIIILIMGFLTVVIAGISLKFYFKLMLVPFSFLILSILTILINVIPPGEPALWCANIFETTIGITLVNLNYACGLFLRSLGAVSCLYFLSLTTPMVDIIAVLRKCKLPEIYLELMSLIYRMIFIVIGIIGKIYTSQDSRLGHSTLKNRFRSISQLISCLFSISYKKTSDLFNALEARCYTGTLKVLEKQCILKKIRLVYALLLNILLINLDILLKNAHLMRY